MVNNYYKRGFLDGFDYIQRSFSNGDKENDKTTPYLIGGGLTTLAGSVYGNSRTFPEQIDKEELVKELNRRKNFLDKIERKISKIDKIKSDVSLFKDIIDWVKGGTIDPATIENELKRGDPTRLKKLLQEKKDEISGLREKIKPLSNKIRNNRLVGAGIGLGTGLAGAALYNHIKSKNNGED